MLDARELGLDPHAPDGRTHYASRAGADHEAVVGMKPSRQPARSGQGRRRLLVLAWALLLPAAVAGNGYLVGRRDLPVNTSPPPSGPVHCVADYEPVAGLLIAWKDEPQLHGVLAQLVGQVTTVGDADVWIAVEDAARQPFRLRLSQAAGAQTNRLHFLVCALDSPWMRDFGPRYIWEGDCRAVVRFTYDWGQKNDDAFSRFFAGRMQHALYELPLRHNGGNFQVSTRGDAHLTRLLTMANPGLTEAELARFLGDYLGVEVTFHPLSYADPSGHLDMWMLLCDERTVMINYWPFDPGSVADRVCEAAAGTMAARGYVVHRLPARSHAWYENHTYANTVICNNLVLIPSFSHPAVAPLNAEALATWRRAMPRATVVPIDCEALVARGGFLHCLVTPIPRPRGGVHPTVLLQTCRGGQVLRPGADATIRWISDDDLGVTGVDLLLSTDGGAAFDQDIASGLAPVGSFRWRVPELDIPRARIRVVARDADGHVGHDDSASDLLIQPMVDEDLDGLADDWERDHFGSTTVAHGGADSDQDQDGFSDLAEFLAGTSPTNAADHLRIGQILRYEADGIRVTWETRNERLYTLSTTTHLGPNTRWQPVYETAGDGRSRSYIRSGLTTPTFYRLEARPP